MPLSLTRIDEASTGWAPTAHDNDEAIEDFVNALETDIDEFPDELKLLTQAEIQQLENIGATTIAAGQWAWLGATSQIHDVTESEWQQIQNIGDLSIVTAEWTYLAQMTGRPGMTDRGDPNAYDWILTTLIEDGAWHELDLSPIVPAGTKTILMRVDYRASAVAKAVTLRKNGNVNVHNTGQIRSQVANVVNYRDIIVACDADRKIEYHMHSPETTLCNFVVRGWWFE